jgi:hypothetical protein
MLRPYNLTRVLKGVNGVFQSTTAAIDSRATCEEDALAMGQSTFELLSDTNWEEVTFQPSAPAILPYTIAWMLTAVPRAVAPYSVTMVMLYSGVYEGVGCEVHSVGWRGHASEFLD